MTAARTRLLTPLGCVLAAMAASLVVASATFALPQGVTKLKGSSRNLPVALTYAAKTRSVNGFAVEYTCRGKKPTTDSDVYTIADGGDDSRALTRTRAGRRIKATLDGRITRFTEDGPRRIGKGKLVIDARVHRTATKRVIRGSMRVRSGTCPSGQRLRLHVVGPR